MFLILIFRFLAGYVRVIFSGDFCERMLNLCAVNSVTLWNIEKCDNGSIAANVSVKNFIKMRQIRGKSGISVKIEEKVGAPFVLKKYSKRIGFAFGLATFVFLLVFLSGFIWKIEVVGNEKVSEAVILNACSELNIREGTRIKSIDTSKAKEQLLIKLNSLSWASLNIEGSRLTVNVSEIKNMTESTSAPSNLLAKVDGVIKKLDVKSGDCLVKVGEAVTKGDILVSGEKVFSETGVVKKTKAKAEIVAETKRTFIVTVPKISIKTVSNGKPIVKRVLSFFSFKIPLYLGQVSRPYNCETRENGLILFGERLPISITEKIFSQTRDIEIKLNNEEAEKFAEEMVKSTLQNGGYISYSLLEETKTVDDERFVLSQTYLCEENIVYEVKIEENILQ